MTNETRWYATQPVGGFAAIREFGTDRVVFAVSAPGPEYGDPPITDEEKSAALALAASAPEQAATIARLERELAEARADAEALRALAAFTNTVPICGRRVVICESYIRDWPFWRVELSTPKREWTAEHSCLAAAIMDAIGKVAK